ncbi:hypothetical protein GE107_14935 [Cohnella sp. CFH 77786]|uniref:response regulator transcription factor n=1 Tax=Cohnella sp. CFH 77786 TaxID=2662265 RepID=UPI001C60EB74|nr:helix-turn-helix transcriptional regulator [Cohnella sp. CFH 77786]MBW5447350.1 hypothetical protein [Cohnella sp. CFH 77786]
MHITINGAVGKLVSEEYLRKIVEAATNFAHIHCLTHRESEILVYLSFFGFSNREIAQCCFIAEKTVKNHIDNMMRKLDIRSSRQLNAILLRTIFNETDELASLKADDKVRKIV